MIEFFLKTRRFQCSVVVKYLRPSLVDGKCSVSFISWSFGLGGFINYGTMEF